MDLGDLTESDILAIKTRVQKLRQKKQEQADAQATAHSGAQMTSLDDVQLPSDPVLCRKWLQQQTASLKHSTTVLKSHYFQQVDLAVSRLSHHSLIQLNHSHKIRLRKTNQQLLPTHLLDQCTTCRCHSATTVWNCKESRFWVYRWEWHALCYQCQPSCWRESLYK